MGEMYVFISYSKFVAKFIFADDAQKMLIMSNINRDLLQL